MRRHAQVAVLLSTVLTLVKSDIGLVFEEWPKWTVLAPGGETELRCKTNLASDRLLWLYDHHDILNNTSTTLEGTSHVFQQTPYITTSKDGLQSVLHIRLHHRPDQYKLQLGLYQCVAWLGAIAVTSLPGQLEVAVLDEFSGASGNLNLTVIEGEPAMIFCPLPDSNPKAELTFYKDGQLLDVSDNEFYWQAQSGDLVLRKVSSSQAGTYVCSAYNDVLTKSVTSSHYTHVNVVTSSGIAEEETKLVIYQDKYILKSGEKAELTCLVSGYSGDIIWKRQEKQIPPEVEYLIDGSLVIPKTDLGHAGLYSCYGTNNTGAEMLLDTIELIVQESPSVTLETTNELAEEGTQVTIKCSSKGFPVPTNVWVFNGRLPTNDPNIKQNGNILSISPIEKKHAGVYQCFAYNVLGAGEGATMINVIPKLITDSKMKISRSKDGKKYLKKTDKDLTAFDYNATEISNENDDVMIPPPRPNITKISDDAVMVSWDISNPTGLPVRFYKVQYRQVFKNMKNRSSKWKTVDEDVPSYVNSLEVTGLKAYNTYKFRLAAVYANHDNLRGPTSKRFFLDKDVKLQPPDRAPDINKLVSVSKTKVTLKWSYSSNITTEGFFILYRETSSARDYTKLTALGDARRQYTITNLHPNVSYDFKIQSFNMAGPSNSSEIVSRRVKVANSSSEVWVTTPVPSYDVVVSESRVVSSFHLYIILGIILSVLLVIVVVSFTVYSCRNKTCDDHDPRRYSPCVLTDDAFDAGQPLRINNIDLNSQNIDSYEGTVITSIS